MLRFTLTLPSGFGRDFKRKARRYWDVEGGMVGALLSFERPLTLAQVREAYGRRYGGFSQGEHSLEEYLAYALVRLAEHGFVRIEPAVRLPLDMLAPLAFGPASPGPAMAAAEEAWEGCGRIVGGVLAAGKVMTLDQVVAASEQALAERPDGTQVNSHVVAAEGGGEGLESDFPLSCRWYMIEAIDGL